MEIGVAVPSSFGLRPMDLSLTNFFEAEEGIEYGEYIEFVDILCSVCPSGICSELMESDSKAIDESVSKKKAAIVIFLFSRNVPLCLIEVISSTTFS